MILVGSCCIRFLLGKGVVVSVAPRCCSREKLGVGRQSRRVRWRIGLALGELERPLAGHLLVGHLSVRRLRGEWAHTVSKQAMRTLQTTHTHWASSQQQSRKGVDCVKACPSCCCCRVFSPMAVGTKECLSVLQGTDIIWPLATTELGILTW